MKQGKRNVGLEVLGFVSFLLLLIFACGFLTACGGKEVEADSLLVMSRDETATKGNFYANPDLAPWGSKSTLSQGKEVTFIRADGANYGNIYLSFWLVRCQDGKELWIPAGSATPKD
jgi:hypothetical protein